MLNSLFPDSKHRPKLTVAKAWVSNIQEWAPKFEDRKPELQTLPDMLDKRLKKEVFVANHTSIKGQN